MKTVRFTKVVEHSGRPEVYLLLTDPKDDDHFQKALKASRVMTIQHAGGKTDSGTVGYLSNTKGELLIFPRSLSPFADDHIVGINYDLLQQDHEPPKKEPKPAPKPKIKAKALPKSEPKPESAAPKKVIQFKKEVPEKEEESEELAEIKADIRRALKALEAGKQVAAFNILKRIVE
jgi:hypothetical protein